MPTRHSPGAIANAKTAHARDAAVAEVMAVADALPAGPKAVDDFGRHQMTQLLGVTFDRGVQYGVKHAKRSR